MYTKLDKEIINLLCCSLCKGPVEKHDHEFVCSDCSTRYGQIQLAQGESEERIFDFRIHRPRYCMPAGLGRWTDVQKEYQAYHTRHASCDDLKVYLDEIDSVEEIYTEEFRLKGRVLDVGGHQGRLRHFLTDRDVPSYVCVDPYPEVFENIVLQPNLLKAYPVLSKPSNFLVCHAENLPFAENTFDWVHMRSVLDHLYDPYLALKDAYRVMKKGGNLLLGLSVRGGKSSLKAVDGMTQNNSFVSVKFRIKRKIQREGLKGLTKAVVDRMRKRASDLGGKRRVDDHTFRWIYEDVIDVLHVTDFDIVKEHWQKPPFTMCVYVAARKN